MTADDAPTSSQSDRGATVRVAVENLPVLLDILDGLPVAFVRSALADRVNAVPRARTAAIAFERDSIEVRFPAPGPAADLPALVDDLLLALGSRPFELGGTQVIAAISAASGNTRGRSVLPPPESLARARAKADMAVAVSVLQAVADDRLYFLFQPITSATGPERTLYTECFSRLVGGAGDSNMQAPRGFMPALERLGLTRWFDRAVVERGLDFLRANPAARIGCNISALSAIDDAWWAPVLGSLSGEPDLAERLVIEITETAPRGEIESTLGFIRAFRRTGCRIAIDNFGAGFSGLRFAVAAAPDIIKIDACYVREQAADAFGATYLGHLVGIASCLASEVVVVGIENDRPGARAPRRRQLAAGAPRRAGDDASRGSVAGRL